MPLISALLHKAQQMEGTVTLKKLYKKRCTFLDMNYILYIFNRSNTKATKGGPILLLTYIRSARVLLLTYKPSSKEWQYGSLVLKWSQYIPLQKEIHDISLNIQSQ